jgi:hypothetical protein
MPHDNHVTRNAYNDKRYDYNDKRHDYNDKWHDYNVKRDEYNVHPNSLCGVHMGISLKERLITEEPVKVKI